jgi:two-component SAPR family response regulator
LAYGIQKVIDPQIEVLFISALDATAELTSIIPGIKEKDILRKPVEPEDFTNRVNEATTCQLIN